MVKEIINAHLKELEDLIGTATSGNELHVVERDIFDTLLELGRDLLREHIRRRGTGYRGEEITLSDGRCMEYFDDRPKVYHSIFGEIQIPRAYYYSDGDGGFHPLDRELNLPEGKYTYLFQKWGVCGCSKEAFDGALSLVKKIFNLSMPKRTLQQRVCEVSADVDGFYESAGYRTDAPDGDILVVEADGKGIPMSGAKKTSKRLGRGEKRLTKKMAEIVTVQTVNSHKLLQDRESGKKCNQSINKMVYGELLEKEEYMTFIRSECDRRAREGPAKKWVFLGDGQPAIWGIHKRHFHEYIPVLDWYHMSEYLWDAAHLLYPETDPRVQKWVSKKETQLLNGQVKRVIRSLHYYYKKLSRKSHQERMTAIIRYFTKNQHRMRYDAYIQNGLPIGTGSVEGACKHLVMTRMEGCGMRWKQTGAQAILKIRTIYINKMEEDFWEYYQQRQKERLYPKVISDNNSLTSRNNDDFRDAA